MRAVEKVRIFAADVLAKTVSHIDNSEYQGDWVKLGANKLWQFQERVRGQCGWRRLRVPYILLPVETYGLCEIAPEETDAVLTYLRGASDE